MFWYCDFVFVCIVDAATSECGFSLRHIFQMQRVVSGEPGAEVDVQQRQTLPAPAASRMIFSLQDESHHTGSSTAAIIIIIIMFRLSSSIC